MRAARRAGTSYGASDEPDWRSVDWRSHLRSIELAGRSLHYVDLGAGEGPPVVFIHGLGGCWQNWLENLPRTARERRVIAMDLPGFGHSELPRDDIAITGYAMMVDALCEQLGLGHVAAVGNSMGGFIGADMAINVPARVERLVLVDAAGFSINDVRREPGRTIMRLITGFGAVNATNVTRVLGRPRARHIALAPVMRHPTRLSADLLLEQSGAVGKPGFLLALDALAAYDFRERLPEIACPALVVQGTDDMLVPLRDAYEFERLIPAARTLILEDTGHVPMLERPRVFNDALIAFLREGRQE